MLALSWIHSIFPVSLRGCKKVIYSELSRRHCISKWSSRLSVLGREASLSMWCLIWPCFLTCIWILDPSKEAFQVSARGYSRCEMFTKVESVMAPEVSWCSGLFFFFFLFDCLGSLLLHKGVLCLPFAGSSLWWRLLLQITGSRHTGLTVPLHMGSFQTRDWTHVLCIGGRILNHWATRKGWGRMGWGRRSKQSGQSASFPKFLS